MLDALGISPVYWLVLAALNAPVFVLVGRGLFFDDWREFGDTVSRWLRWDTSPLWSALTGEIEGDRWAVVKLACFLLVCAAVVYAEHRLVLRHWLGP